MSSTIQIASEQIRSGIRAASWGFFHDAAPLARLLAEQGVNQNGIEGLWRVLEQTELADPCVGLEVEFLGKGFTQIPIDCERFAGPIDWTRKGNILIGICQLEMFNKMTIFVAVVDSCWGCPAARLCQRREELQLA